MIATTHPVSPEEVMALADGELSSAEAARVSAHIAGCAECASLAAQLRDTSESLSRWIVPAVSATLEEAVKVAAAKAASDPSPAKSTQKVGPGIWKWNLWATGGRRAIAAFAILLVVGSTIWVLSDQPYKRQRMMTIVAPAPGEPALPRQESRDVAGGLAVMEAIQQPSPQGFASRSFFNGGGAALKDRRSPVVHEKLASTVASSPAPLIARSVSLTIQVRDLGASRAALEALLARHRGYAAQLTVNTGEGLACSLESSLRVPDGELAAAIAEMRGLGQVEVETQSGEEVTQQHADLVARLENSRETEQRLRELLAQRTGKIDEVLQVEEEIDRVRGEIEQMEADQKVLEHRVDFATIELRMMEQYREQLGPQSASLPNQIRNAFVSGLRHGENTLLGILLFVEEAGPTLLIWLVILGVPGFLAWRRYRRMRAKF